MRTKGESLSDLLPFRVRSLWIFAASLLLVSSALPQAVLSQSEDPLDLDKPRWQRRADRLVSRGRVGPAMRIVRRQLTRQPEESRPRHFVCERLLPQASTPSIQREIAALAANWHSAEDAPSERPRYARCQFDAVRRVDLVTALELVTSDPLLGPPQFRQVVRSALLSHQDSLAEQALVALIAAAPRDSDALATLAALTMRRGENARALGLYRRRVEIDPSSVGARRDVAGALLALGQDDDALRILESLVNERPDDLNLRVDLLNALLELGRFEAVASLGRAALPRAPRSDARVHRVLGLALLALHQDVEAQRVLSEAAERAPNDLRIRTALDGLDRAN